MSRLFQAFVKTGPAPVSQRSYFQAIKDGLPLSLTDGPAVKKITKDSATRSYKLTTIPKAVRARAVETYEKTGFEYLSILEPFLTDKLAPIAVGNESLEEFSTEGTVVASYQQHVGNPINTALMMTVGKFDFEYKVKYEFGTKNDDNYVDVIFSLKAPGTEEEEIFAIVELKNRGIILDSLENFQSSTIESEADLPQKTLLRSSAKNLANQATRYAYNLKCPHVALFDWDNLILLDFIQLQDALKNKKSDSPYAGEIVDATHVSDPKRITNALFGFVLQGLEAKLDALQVKL